MPDMSVHPARGKKAVAADVWRLMLECSMAQFGRASGILHALGLTPGHTKLLMHLDEGDGHAMGSLAQSFRCDASTMTWLVDRLEERGMVERRMLATDRRVKAVALTPLGVKTKAELVERLYEPPDQLMALDRAALEELQETLRKIQSSTEGTRESVPEGHLETAEATRGPARAGPPA